MFHKRPPLWPFVLAFVALIIGNGFLWTSVFPGQDGISTLISFCGGVVISCVLMVLWGIWDDHRHRVYVSKVLEFITGRKYE